MESIPLMYAQKDCDMERQESSNDDFSYCSNVKNADKEIRLAFVRKVYGLLSIQLLAAIVFSTWFQLSETVHDFMVDFRDFLLVNALVLSLGSLCAFIAKQVNSVDVCLLSVFTRLCRGRVSQRWPKKCLCVSYMTIIQAYTAAMIVNTYDTFVVLQALGLTFAAVFALTIFTFNTKRDFSFFARYGAVAGLIVLFPADLLIRLLNESTYRCALSFCGAVFFGLFLVCHTQQIMTTISPKDYILATIYLYIVIVNLLIYLLRIVHDIDDLS